MFSLQFETYFIEQAALSAVFIGRYKEAEILVGGF